MLNGPYSALEKPTPTSHMHPGPVGCVRCVRTFGTMSFTFIVCSQAPSRGARRRRRRRWHRADALRYAVRHRLIHFHCVVVVVAVDTSVLEILESGMRLTRSPFRHSTSDSPTCRARQSRSFPQLRRRCRRTRSRSPSVAPLGLAVVVIAAPVHRTLILLGNSPRQSILQMM